MGKICYYCDIALSALQKFLHLGQIPVQMEKSGLSGFWTEKKFYNNGHWFMTYLMIKIQVKYFSCSSLVDTLTPVAIAIAYTDTSCISDYLVVSSLIPQNF